HLPPAPTPPLSPYTTLFRSARSARLRHFPSSRSCSAIFLSRGSGGTPFGPRGFGASPSSSPRSRAARHVVRADQYSPSRRSSAPDRKSTRLNSSHQIISYAV